MTPAKIPVEILLKFSRREARTLKSEIEELKYENNKLRNLLNNIHNSGKQAKIEARKEELYNNLRTQVSALQQKCTKYKREKNEVLTELIKYKQRYGNAL